MHLGSKVPFSYLLYNSCNIRDYTCRILPREFFHVLCNPSVDPEYNWVLCFNLQTLRPVASPLLSNDKKSKYARHCSSVRASFGCNLARLYFTMSQCSHLFICRVFVRLIVAAAVVENALLIRTFPARVIAGDVMIANPVNVVASAEVDC